MAARRQGRNRDDCVSMAVPIISRETAMNSLRYAARMSTLLQAFVLALLLAGCQSITPTPDEAARQKIDRLLMLVDQRLEVAVKVAQTKWNSGAPINDPAREQKILDDLTASLKISGAEEKSFMRRFFQAQFDAGKIIQVGLHAQWRQEARARFTNPPDLARDIRPELDRLTPLLIDALIQVRPLLQQESVREYLKQRAAVLVRGDANGAVRAEALRVLLE
jgi:chorismate mutase